MVIKHETERKTIYSNCGVCSIIWIRNMEYNKAIREKNWWLLYKDVTHGVKHIMEVKTYQQRFTSASSSSNIEDKEEENETCRSLCPSQRRSSK